MLLACVLSLCFAYSHSEVRALESELKVALRHVSFQSKELSEVTTRVAAKHQKGLPKGESGVYFQKCLGPTPMKLARIGLEMTRFNEDNSYDQTNFAFWPTQSGTGVQFLDGYSDIEKNDPSYMVGEAYRKGDRLIRCGATTREGNRSWPGARVYRLVRGKWTVVANKEIEWPFGFAEFKRTKNGVSPETIISRTWDLPKNFGAPMSGPALRYVQTWTIRNDRFLVGKIQLVQNSLAELDRLVGLATSGRREAFDARVPRSISRKLWTILSLKGEFYGVTIKGSTDGDTFRIGDSDDESRLKTKVIFEKRSGKWRAVRLTSK